MIKRALVLGLAVFNFGFIELPERESPIVGDDLRCETANGGGALAIDWDEKRVWQTDPGEPTGLEVTVQEFSQARCGLHLAIKGLLELGGESINVEVTVDGQNDSKEINAQYKLIMPDAEGDGPDESQSFEMKCKLTSAVKRSRGC